MSRFKPNQAALVRVRVMTRTDEYGQTEWVCQPILMNGQDCPNSVAITVPDASVISVPEAVETIMKRRRQKETDSW
jgi:hypothetical protein